MNEIANTGKINSNNNQPIRRSSRLRTNNPIVRFGNPLTHKRLQETPLTKSTRSSPSHRVNKKGPDREAEHAKSHPVTSTAEEER